MLSRALICVITCSIIFSYAVLCPQAEGSYTFFSNGPYSVSNIELAYDFLGKEIIPLLDFVPETYLYYNVRSSVYAISVGDSDFVLNGTWEFSSFDELSLFPVGVYDLSFDFTFIYDSGTYSCTGFSYQVSDDITSLYFIDNLGNYHQVYNNGVYQPVYVYFNNTVVTDPDLFEFIRLNFYCTSLPAFDDALVSYPLTVSFSDFNSDFINISFSLAFPFNFNPSAENPYEFVQEIFAYNSFYDSNSFFSVPHTLLSTHEYVGNDEFTGVSYTYYSFEYVLDLSSFSDVENLLTFVILPTFNTSVVGYYEAGAFISPLTIEFSTTLDEAVLNSINNVVNKLEETNATLKNIQNTLTNVTPEMQQSLDSLETLMHDEAGKVENVINGMEQIGTDFGTEIGDFDNILNENAGMLEDIGSTTYNSFINDVFGNWFFVSMFALFGAFAFFSRAVFG